MQLISAPLALPDASAAPARDFAVVVDGQRILDCGARAQMLDAYPRADRLHVTGAVMLPGLVNSHDHGRGFGTASRGIPDDTLEAWLPLLRAQPDLDPYLAAAFDGTRLLRSGVTATAHSHNPLDWRNMKAESVATLRGYAAAGIRVGFHAPMVDQNMLVYADAERVLAQLSESERAIALASGAPPPLTHDEYFALCAELYDAHHDAAGHTAYIQVSPAGGQWCSDALVLRAVEFALARGTRVQMHMLETRFQRAYAERTWGKSFIRHLDDIGALGPWLTLAHMVWVDLADLDLLAQRGVSVAHNPSSNLRLRSGIAPFSALRRAGVNVGIGLDGHGLDDDQDYLRELRLAWVLANMRDQLEAPAAEPVSAAAVLEAGSSNGARATLGDAPLGRLAPGNLADVVLIDLDAAPFDVLAGSAMLDAAAALLHLATRRHVRHVMVNGEWAVRDGRCTRVDERALERELRAQLRAATNVRQTIRPAVVREFYAAWLEPPL